MTLHRDAAVNQAIQRSNINDKNNAYKHYLAAADGKSNSDARDIAADILGERIFWDWDSALFVSILHLIVKFIISHTSPEDP